MFMGGRVSHRKNAGTLGMVPLIINPIYTLHIPLLKGSNRGVKQLGAHHPKGFPTIFPMDFFSRHPHLHRHINGFHPQERSSQKTLQTLHAGLGHLAPLGPAGIGWLGPKPRKKWQQIKGIWTSYGRKPITQNAEHIYGIFTDTFFLECGHFSTFHAGKSSIRSASLGLLLNLMNG